MEPKPIFELLAPLFSKGLVPLSVSDGFVAMRLNDEIIVVPDEDTTLEELARYNATLGRLLEELGEPPPREAQNSTEHAFAVTAETLETRLGKHKTDLEQANLQFQYNFTTIGLALLSFILSIFVGFLVWGIDSKIEAAKMQSELQLERNLRDQSSRIHEVEKVLGKMHKKLFTEK